jgi:hypothetical protein
MRHNSRSIPVAVFALAMALAGCGGDPTPNGETPTTSGKSAEAEAAYRQLEEAWRPMVCNHSVYQDTANAAYDNNVPAMRDNAVKYRDTVTTWHDQVGKISFPPAAQPIVDKIRELDLDELNDLNALAAVTDPEHTNLIDYADFHHWSLMVETDGLMAAVGHPVSDPRLAAHQLDLAFQTYFKDQRWMTPLFDAALAHNDLNAAKAANVGDENALQRYIDRLDAIKWPEGFEGQVNELRDNLRKMIEFDRRQVDVATAAQVVKAPDEGTPESLAATDLESALNDQLREKAAESDLPKC